MKQGNLLIADGYSPDPGYEFFETLFTGNEFRVERIISTGHQTIEGQWYDQEHDEWVLLMQGKAIIEFANGQMCPLKPGDYLFIPAHERHRVAETSNDPSCYWLALHGKFNIE